MYKRVIHCSVESPVYKQKDSKDLIVAVDQYNSQDFNRGFNGFPANDLTLLERAQSLAECQLIAQRLQEFKVNNPNTDGMSDADILKTIKPRLYQSPSEVNRWLDYYYENVVEPSIRSKQVVEPTPIVDPSPTPVSE